VHRADYLSTFWEPQIPGALKDCLGLYSIGYIYASGIDGNMPCRGPVGRPRGKWEVSRCHKTGFGDVDWTELAHNFGGTSHSITRISNISHGYVNV
jgi:hypothetical protein